jgi:predicted dehydrogenase
LYRPKLHYDWHWDFNTGCGDIGNQGLHQMDVARWYLGEDKLAPRAISVGGRLGYEDAANTPNSQTVLLDYASAPLIFETRGLPKSKADQANWGSSMDNYKGSQIGVIVECEDGYLSSSSSYQTVEVFNPAGEQIAQFRGGGNHFQNFLAALESGRREDLNAEVLEGHLSAALCHMANISHKLGEKRTASEIKSAIGSNADFAQSVDRLLAHLAANEIDVDAATVTLGPMLEFDIETEKFTNNPAANGLLRREDRQPFVVPEVS